MRHCLTTCRASASITTTAVLLWANVALAADATTANIPPEGRIPEPLRARMILAVWAVVLLGLFLLVMIRLSSHRLKRLLRKGRRKSLHAPPSQQSSNLR